MRHVHGADTDGMSFRVRFHGAYFSHDRGAIVVTPWWLKMKLPIGGAIADGKIGVSSMRRE